MSNQINRIIKSQELDILQEDLQNDIKYTFKGPSSGLSHLKSALYDWRVENQWEKENSYVFQYGNKQGFIFFTITTREPKHCTLRHIFVLEGNRGLNIGDKLYNYMINILKENNINRLRMFINIPAIGFYKKYGIIEYHGYSKTKLPFYYGDLSGNLIKLPKAQLRYVKTDLHIMNINKKIKLF